MTKLIFVTWNINKLKEAKSLLQDFDIENEKIDLIEIQWDSEEIARYKIQTAFDIIKKPCFIEDTALFFEERKNKLPWPYIKDFATNIWIKELPKLLKHNFNATAQTTIAYHDWKNIHIFIWQKRWKMFTHCGIDKFTRDPIFQPEWLNKTYAELTHKEKNQISHRSKAFKNFENFLKNNE